MLSPAFDEHLGFLQCVEDFRVQQLIAELAVERFVVAVLPRAIRLDEQRLHPEPVQPVSDGLGGELRPLIGEDVLRPTDQTPFQES